MELFAQFKSFLASQFQTSSQRYQMVDVYRGIALLAMVIYHFCFFSNVYGVFHIPITSDLRWIIFQKSIAASFFFLVGVSLYLAYGSGIHYGKFAKRLSLLIFCAVIVTSTSLLFFPNAVVWFGILHAIAICSVLGLLFLRFQILNIVIAIPIIWMGISYSSPAFNETYLYWFGLGTEHFNTLDYQPLAPWFGVVLLGIAAGSLLQKSTFKHRSYNTAPVLMLTYLGKHTLFLYMAHVPFILLVMEIISL